jgi:hypothetical protein
MFKELLPGNELINSVTVCWRTGYILEDWGVAVVIPIYKKGSRNL